MKKLKVGFFPAHPAQLWMMKALSENAPPNIEVVWFIRDKDVCLQLANELGIEYTLVSKAGKKFITNAIELIINIFKFVYYTKNKNIDIWLSKYGSVNISSFLMRKPNISFNDDDEHIVPLIALTSYPFANNIICPLWTKMSKFQDKLIRYNSFHELFYLHPDRFDNGLKPRKNIKSPYAIIRLSSLSAHHDLGQKGISIQALENIIALLETNFCVLISSEKELPDTLQKYQVSIPVSEMHSVLANAAILVSDSQSMTAEAAVLGIKNIRISSFKGKISYLDKLEQLGLSWSCKPDSEDILQTIKHVVELPYTELTSNRKKLLSNSENPLPIFWHAILKLTK